MKSKKENYDVCIIGGGIGGLMAAYRLMDKKPGCRVIIIEKGLDIDKRVCPIVNGTSQICVKCPRCAIMEGLAGAGAFSDGKYCDIIRVWWMADGIYVRRTADPLYRRSG